MAVGSYKAWLSPKKLTLEINFSPYNIVQGFKHSFFQSPWGNLLIRFSIQINSEICFCLLGKSVEIGKRGS